MNPNDKSNSSGYLPAPEEELAPDVFDIDLPDYTQRPDRPRTSSLHWSEILDSFAPMVREFYESHLEDRDAHWEKYRITETERFRL